jgi:hypothetical protein
MKPYDELKDILEKAPGISIKKSYYRMIDIFSILVDKNAFYYYIDSR